MVWAGAGGGAATAGGGTGEDEGDAVVEVLCASDPPRCEFHGCQAKTPPTTGAKATAATAKIAGRPYLR
jgi:hypothetical protein